MAFMICPGCGEDYEVKAEILTGSLTPGRTTTAGSSLKTKPDPDYQPPTIGHLCRRRG